MIDNELNALVAERVMGLKNVRPMYGQTVYDMIHTYAMDSKGQETITYQPAPIPDYANDIAAAWQVALKVSSFHGYNVTIHVGDEVWIERAVETDGGNTHLITWQDVARVGTAEGDARAICLAALEAVGVEVK